MNNNENNTKTFKSTIYQRDGMIDATLLYKDIEDAIEKEKNERKNSDLFKEIESRLTQYNFLSSDLFFSDIEKILSKDKSSEFANQRLQVEIEDFIKENKENQNVKANIVKDLQYKLEKLDRGHPLQHILNSTSGAYVAPTSMKSFDSCPCGYLYGKTVTEKTGTATSMGRTVHDIFESFYLSEDRSKKNLLLLTEQKIELDQQFDKKIEIEQHVEGYWSSPDYVTGKAFDHSGLVCATEVFIKQHIKPLGVDLGVMLYTKIDRIDIRSEGIFPIDYKTGLGDPNPFLLGADGYLPQMIFYKWAVEAEYGEKIKEAYLSLPGASDQHKYTKMNVNSLVEQSRVIDGTFRHLEYARAIRESKQFPTKIMRYCTSCQMKHVCSTFIKHKGLDESKILSEIQVEINY